MPNKCLVIMPALPNSMITDKDNTNGGETTGNIETILNSPLIKRLLSLTYTSTYAKSRPINVAIIPTKNPTFSVLMIAVSNVGIAKTRANTSSVGPCSPTMLSTIKIASGYKINSTSAATSTIIVDTKIGSAKSFLRSSCAL